MSEVYTVRTESPEDTVRFGIALGRSLAEPATILLIGGMGAGKTVMTRGIVEGIGIQDDVSSPTYTLVNAYSDGVQAVYHFDLYRLTDVDELYEMGFEDYLKEGGTLVIEWPQIAADYPFTHLITITIDQPEDAPDERVFTIETEEPGVVEGLKSQGWSA